MNELAKGTLLQTDKYTIEGVIGSGGFGITYRARHNVLGHQYAVKEFFINGYCVRNILRKTVVLQGIDETIFDNYRKKFIEEAQILAALDHPNIVKVVDIFQENNTAYIVMPLLQGQTLQQLVEREGRLQYEVAVNYIAQLSEAVDYIHQKNILHRDIKPDNVVILPDNRAILIDFGSAREFIQNKTQAQTSILTAGYAPLEQYSTISKKGSYTDIYSLGATFYFALTGEKPMDATARTTETMPEPQELAPDIPDEANRTILKAMELRPNMRHQQVTDFMADLLNKSYKAKAETTTTVASKAYKRGYSVSKNLKNIGIVLLFMLVIGFVAVFLANLDILQQKRNEPVESVQPSTPVAQPEKTLTADELNRLHDAKKRANDFYNKAIELNDSDIKKMALEQCNKALSIKPDDSEMKELKKKITGY